MRSNRRRFLLAGGALATVAAGGGSLWAALSPGRTARWLRQMAQDGQRRVLAAPVKPEPAAWPENAVTACWLGHASVLLNFYGVRILIDPVLSDRVGVDAGLATLGPKRYIAPALTWPELPPIDLVVLSHAHMDHLDLPTLGRFSQPVFAVTAKDTADLLQGTRLQEARELGWGDATTYRGAKGEVRIQAFEVRHWGRRWPSKRERGYNGYVFSREGRSILFGGDTAYTPEFARLRRLGPFALAIMPIAAYDPWIRNHCTPEQAIAMADLAGARQVVPVHHQTFKLSDEPMTEPIMRLENALRSERGRMGLRQVGEHVTVA